MADMRFLKAHHQRPEFREAEPLRYLTAQDATFGFRSDFAFAGNDKHEGQPFTVGALKETRQGPVRAGLRHAVQVEPGFDLFPAARKLRTLAASQWRERGR